jgi:hypothetical protein
MQTLIICIGCSNNKPHHSKGYCRNCYHKFIVRKTGDFDRNKPETYQQHLSMIKEKISKTQKQRVRNAIISKLSAEQLKRLYCDEKLSMGDIAKSFNCSRTYIMLLLKQYNLPIRSKSTARAEAKKQGKNVKFSSINENFFKKLIPEMAYVLGFIYSDGNISNLLDHFSISQKEPEILHKIKELMSSEHQIARQNHQELYTLAIGNKVMINDLLSWGLTPNKSLDIKFPVLPKDLYSHFIRGYFDGDGSIFLAKDGWRVNFVSGSRDFMHSLEKLLNEVAWLSKRPVYNYPTKINSHQIIYLKEEDLTVLYEYMYCDTALTKELHLTRKQKLFSRALASFERNNMGEGAD